MSELGDWLEGRHPKAPEDLRRRIVAAVQLPSQPRHEESTGDISAGAGGREPRSLADARVERLLDAASDRLAEARSRPGRVRDSALELLVADALVTYACEAALEGARPEAALSRIMGVGGTR